MQWKIGHLTPDFLKSPENPFGSPTIVFAVSVTIEEHVSKPSHLSKQLRTASKMSDSFVVPWS
jgi:hypothetical protein